MHPKKILVAEDHPLMRLQLTNTLKSEWNEVLIIEVTNGIEAINAYEKHKPDLIIFDYQMPLLSGFDAAEYILRKNKLANIVLLTLFDTIPVALNFLKIGGKGFISKGCSVEELILCVKRVYKGDYYFQSKHEELMIKFLQKGLSTNIPQIQFTEREVSLVLELSKGKTNAEIASQLNLSPRTIESYRYDLIKRAQVNNSIELIYYFFSNGIAKSIS